MTSYTEGQPNYTINFSNGYAISWEGDGEGWITDEDDVSVTGNTRIWRYQLNVNTGEETAHNACTKFYMTIGNGRESVQISGGAREDVDGRTDRFVWFYIGNNTNLFYLDGFYYSDEPRVVIDSSSTTWEDVPYSENYKSARLYTLNESTGRENYQSNGAFNFETNRYANVSIDDNQYVYFNGLTNEYGDGLYWYNGTFYTEPPSVGRGGGGEVEVECTRSDPEQVEGRYYTGSNGIRSITGMYPKRGSSPTWYYAGFGAYWVSTAGGSANTGPVEYYCLTDLDIDDITGSMWDSYGTIEQDGYYMDFSSGRVYYYDYEQYYYYDAPSWRYEADGTYTYSSGGKTYRIVISNGSFLSHEEQTTSSTYKYIASNKLSGIFESGSDYNDNWRYTFSNGILTSLERYGTTHVEQNFSNPTNTSGRYTNFYFWTKYADISTGSSGSPQGNRITIYNNDENGQIEIRFNTSGVLTTVNKRRAPTATYNDRFMFRCNDLWRDGSWSGDGLIFIDGLLWQTSTHLGE